MGAQTNKQENTEYETVIIRYIDKESCKVTNFSLNNAVLKMMTHELARARF